MPSCSPEIASAQLDGVQSHIDAIAAGELVEDRLALIAGSNVLSEEARRRQRYFVKSFCLMAALLPSCGRTIDLGGGVMLALNRPSHEIEGFELPGVRVDGSGDLVIEGHFRRGGNDGRNFDESGFPLWPLVLRNAPVFGSGPFENFRPQALALLAEIGQGWPLFSVAA